MGPRHNASNKVTARHGAGETREEASPSATVPPRAYHSRRRFNMATVTNPSSSMAEVTIQKA